MPASSALGDLLPAALGVAISPIPIIATVLMLLWRQARKAAPAFAIGWVLGLVVVMLIVLAIAGPDGIDTLSTSDRTSWIKLVIALLFLLLALNTWRKRPRPGQPIEPPKWMASLDKVSPLAALGLGAALSALNPKNLALAVSGAVAIASSGVDTPRTVACVVVRAESRVEGPSAQGPWPLLEKASAEEAGTTKDTQAPTEKTMNEPFDIPVECRELLSAGLVGRVAICTPLGPHIVPVNYGVVDDSVVLRTSPYSVLGSHAGGSIVALEVDHFDYERQQGWSVVARGRATAVTTAEELKHVRDVWEPNPWAAGQRNLYLRIRWTEITGRRLGSGWKPADDLPVRRVI